MKNKQTCSNCRKKLDIGVDAIKVSNGVIGLKGFIPLDEILYFCGEECLRDYYDLSALPKMQRRLP